jgi:hypothetical protein
MATRGLREARPGLLSRLATEAYVGALVIGAMVMAAAGVAVVVTVAMQVSAWVRAAD